MKKHIGKIVLAAIIAAQFYYTLYAFFVFRQGGHSDEVWTYGIANSYYGYMDAYDWEKMETWIPGEFFKDYITVQENERFTFGSVYQNSTHDMCPVLYALLLHIVCSFFPDTFLWMYGFSLNLVFLVGTQIYLYLLVRKITKSEAAALLTCLFYGGGMGTACIFTFVRAYSLLTMLCVMYTYYAACCYETVKETGKLRARYVIPAAIAAILSFLTHYYGIAYVGVYTALFCVYLLCHKKIKPMLIYGMSMLGSLGIFCAMYPSAIKSVTGFESSGGLVAAEDLGTSFSAGVQFRLLLDYLCRYDYGFRVRWFPTAFWDITLPLVGAAIVAAVMLVIPFRDEEWLHELLRKGKRKVLEFIQYLKRANYVPAFVLGSCVILMRGIAERVELYLMGRYVLRYLSLVMPLAAMVTVVALGVVLPKLTRKKAIAYAIIMALICVGLARVHLNEKFPFTFYSAGAKEDLVESTKGKNVLIVGAESGYFVTDVAFFTPYLYEAEGIFFTYADTIDDLMAEGSYEGKNIDYLIVSDEVFKLPEEKYAALQELALQNGVRIAQNTGGREVGGITIENPEDDGLEKTNLILEMIGNRDYEARQVILGQTGSYDVLKLAE